MDCCTRRNFLFDMTAGIFGVALSAMLQRDARATPAERWTPPDGRPHFSPRARSVIWLFMNGGVSHLESFDPKPELNRFAGRTIAQTPYPDVQNPARLAMNNRVVVVNDANGQHQPTLFPTQVGFHKYGQSGIEVSDWFPHIGRRIDDIAVVRSLWTTDNNHGAQTQFHSGRHMLDGQYPTLGAWVTYGLGSLNDNLPQFVSLGNRVYWNDRDGHYLGPAYDAVPLRLDPSRPVDYARPESPLSPEAQQIGFDLVGQLNQANARRYPDDPALQARIRSYELAFRMQNALPEVLRINDETEETRRLYGLDSPTTRRLRHAMPRLPPAGRAWRALRANPAWRRRRGRLGRAQRPAQQPRPQLRTRRPADRRAPRRPQAPRPARRDDRHFRYRVRPHARSARRHRRDHHIYGFSSWMAGGGIKGGTVHGATDELGFHAVEDRHYVTDIHATILHLLGLDSHRLEIPGRQRLAIDHGTPIREIMA